MPIPAAEEIAAPKPEPALSATSDAPIIQEAPPSAETPSPEPVDGEEQGEDTAATAEQAGEAADQPDGEAQEVEAKIKRTPQEEAAWTRLRKEAKAERERADEAQRLLKETLERLPKIEPEAPKDDPRPHRADYVDPDAYERELLEWNARQLAPKVRQETLQQIQQQQREAYGSKLFSEFKAREEAFIEDHPDYADVVSDDLPINAYVAEAIFGAENGPAVHYWLGQNRDEAQRLAQMPVAQALAEVGRISAKLAAPPPRAPRVRMEPSRPVGSRGEAVRDVNDYSMEEHARWYREREAARRGTA